MANREEGIQKLEGQWEKDEAWYEVSFQYGENEEGPYFRMRYEKTRPQEKFFAVNLQNSIEVNDKIQRFRRLSIPLDECQCEKVEERMVVCASYGENPRIVHRFFDAVVTQVHLQQNEHRRGQECSCRFNVRWLNGPSAEIVHEDFVYARNICLLTRGSIEDHPVIQFLRRALEENNKRAEERDVHTRSNAIVTNDNELTSSVERESNVGSSHQSTSSSSTGTGNTLVRRVLNVPGQAPVLHPNQPDEASVVPTPNVAIQAPPFIDSNATVTNDNELKSSVERESSAGSSHEASTTNLSGPGNTDLNVAIQARPFTCSGSTVANDNELRSSVERESNVGSGHEAVTTSSSGSSIITFGKVRNVPGQAPVLDLNQPVQAPAVPDRNVAIPSRPLIPDLNEPPPDSE